MTIQLLWTIDAENCQLAIPALATEIQKFVRLKSQIGMYRLPKSMIFAHKLDLNGRRNEGLASLYYDRSSSVPGDETVPGSILQQVDMGEGAASVFGNHRELSPQGSEPIRSSLSNLRLLRCVGR